MNAIRPYAGHPLTDPDPSPEVIQAKRNDKFRAMAPTLIGALITGRPLPGEVVRTRGKRQPAPAPLPASVSPTRYARDDIELDQPHADPERELLDQQGLVIGFHEIRTARVRSGPAYLLARGTIGREHFEAAERYLDVVAAMGGVRDGEWGSGIRVPAHQQGHPSQAIVDAHSAMRVAVDRVGKGPMGLIGAMCIDGATMANLSLLMDEPEKHTIGRLKAALERLREVWGMDGPRRK
jgi:hypothetical protein